MRAKYSHKVWEEFANTFESFDFSLKMYILRVAPRSTIWELELQDD